MMNSEKVVENLNYVDNNLNNTAIDSISDSIRALEKIENIDKKYSDKLIELKNVYYEVQELARDISGMSEEIYFDEEEINEVETRIDIIHSLKRKYGNSIKEILSYKEEIENEINRIDNLEEENIKLKKKLEKITTNMQELCVLITNLREKYVLILNEKINLELSDLDMPNARFNAKIIETNSFTENGLSQIEFMISTNIGEDEKPLYKIASGGEMSRIMLAIKTVLADVDEVPVLIFDEIDTGISGKAANMVGKKLRKISSKHQVLIVTHLAPIAAKGEYNYYIYKETEQGKTKTRIKQLTEFETIREIARIASGEITDIAISHAQELRKASVA